MELKTAIVLVGGKALRMRPYTEDTPKCMIEIGGKPLLHWILKWLKANDIQRVVLGVDYKREIIIDYVAKNDYGMDIVCNEHSKAEETGDAIRMAIENQNVDDEVFLVMNGDELTDLPLKDFLAAHEKHNPTVTLLSCPLRSTYGVVSIDENDTVTEFKEKPVIEEYFMNAGFYLFSQDVRKYLPDKGSLEKITFAQLSKEGKIKAFKYTGFWATADTVKDIKALEEHSSVLKELYG